MESELLKDKILSQFPNAEIEDGLQFLTCTIPATDLHTMAQFLKQTEELAFDYLFCLTGMDWPEEMSVVYHLKSTAHRHCLVVKAVIPDRQKPKIDTVSDIWRTAEFHEREAYDLFGIEFNNHPDLRRIFLTDDWKGWPLRKDYRDDINIVEL